MLGNSELGRKRGFSLVICSFESFRSYWVRVVVFGVGVGVFFVFWVLGGRFCYFNLVLVFVMVFFVFSFLV